MWTGRECSLLLGPWLQLQQLFHVAQPELVEGEEVLVALLLWRNIMQAQLPLLSGGEALAGSGRQRGLVVLVGGVQEHRLQAQLVQQAIFGTTHLVAEEALDELLLRGARNLRVLWIKWRSSQASGSPPRLPPAPVFC